MGHLTSNETWATVDVDTTTGRIFVQQDWFYVWCVWPGQPAWTHAEKVAFHTSADRAIWGAWSIRMYVKVRGQPPFAARRIPVTFDVRWQPSGHFNYLVQAWKVPPGSAPDDPVRSEVLFGNYIKLSSADLMPRSAVNDAGKERSRFVAPPHEFGHTIGAPDEYNTPTKVRPNPHLADTNSIMNIGGQVRARHLALLTQTLHTMMPGAWFSA